MEGQNLVVERRSADSRPERLPGLAAELLRLNVDMILASGEQTTVVLLKATSTIPVVQRQRADGLIVEGNGITSRHVRLIMQFMARRRLPAAGHSRAFAQAGGLVGYGADVPANFRRASIYADKILNGAKPADLPVEQPSKFELVINVKTAKSLAVTIPSSLLVRANEVIQ